MQNLGGQIRCIMGDGQVTNPAFLTEQAWSIKYLLYCQIIVVLIHNGLSCCYLVFYEQAGHQDPDLSHFLLTLSSVLHVTAKRSHGTPRDTIARSRVFRPSNTLDTPGNEAVYLTTSSTDIFKTNRDLLRMRCVAKIPCRMIGMGSNSARDISMPRTPRMVADTFFG